MIVSCVLIVGLLILLFSMIGPVEPLPPYAYFFLALMGGVVIIILVIRKIDYKLKLHGKGMKLRTLSLVLNLTLILCIFLPAGIIANIGNGSIIALITFLTFLFVSFYSFFMKEQKKFANSDGSPKISMVCPNCNLNISGYVLICPRCGHRFY